MKRRLESSRSGTAGLPIAGFRHKIVDAVKKYATTIVVAETGSGKSTQLAQYLVDEPRRSGAPPYRVVCTQPRRVAAITIAQRVAHERNCKLGEEVGYSIRFEDKTSARTLIRYVTDGVLLRECLADRDLSRYDAVLLDESHERSLQTDILMGLLRLLQERRPSLRIVVMSATLDVDLFASFFRDSIHISVPGRQFPVHVMYTIEPEEDFIDAALLTVLQIHAEEEPGAVLVFLPGQEDIENLVGMLEDHLPAVKGRGGENNISLVRNGFRDYLVLPLYAALSQEEQMRAFESTTEGVRKIVVATNIAETSLTISGVRYVVDTGFSKTRAVNAATGVESLRTAPISQSQANQRAGRAGRESAGKCFRLYTEDAFDALPVSAVPEIRRVNITQVVLQLKVLGVSDPAAFPFPSPPSQQSLARAIRVLVALGALDKSSKDLTAHGDRMARLPLEPMLAHMLLCSVEHGCVREALTAVAALSTENIFLQPHRDEDKQLAAIAHKKFSSKEGDLPSLINLYWSWVKANKDRNWARHQFLSQRALLHAAEVFKQLSALLVDMGIDPDVSSLPDKEPFLRCVAKGLCLNVAKKVVLSAFVGKNSKGITNKLGAPAAPYKSLVWGQDVHLHPSSVLFSLPGGERRLPEYVVYAEVLVTTKEYMRCVTAVEEKWLTDAAPDLFKTKQ